MPLSPFRAKPKGKRWCSAFLWPLLSGALSVAATEPVHAQAIPKPAGNAAKATTKTGANTAKEGGASTNKSALALTGSSYTATVDLSETAASNGRGLNKNITSSFGGRGPDEITTAQFNLTAHDHTERFDGDAQYTLRGDYFARGTARSKLSHDLDAITKTVLVPEYFEVQARAVARQLYVNQLGALAASDLPVSNGAGSGLRQTFAETLTPDFKFRIGDFAQSEGSVTQTGIFFDNPNNNKVTTTIPGEDQPTDTTSYGASEKISSGSDFTRVNWTLSASGRQTQRHAGDMSEVDEIADLKYAVSHEFFLTGTVGYEAISSQQKLTHDLRGLLAMGGFQVTVGQHFEASAQAGQQFNFPSYKGDLKYQVTARTTLNGSLTDTVTTPAQRLLDSLNALDVNSQGEFVDTSLGETGVDAFNPSPIDGLGISGNNISRYRSALLSLGFDDGRTNYRLTGFETIRDRLTVDTSKTPPRQMSTGATFAISRQMTPNLKSTVSLTYTTYDVLGGRTNIARASFEMNYMMTDKMSVYMRASYLDRLSSATLVAASPLSGSLTDIVATIGLRRSF